MRMLAQDGRCAYGLLYVAAVQPQSLGNFDDAARPSRSGYLVVNRYDHGTTNLGGPVPGISVSTLTKGELKAYANAGTTTTSFNAKTCTQVVNVKSQYWNVAGTGRYRDALGYGTWSIRSLE